MRIDGLQLLDQSKAVNFTVDSGTTFPPGGVGELFYLTTGTKGLYVYSTEGWVAVGASSSSGGSGEITSATLPAGNSNLSCGKVASIIRCTATAPCRIRLYCTSAGRSADADRFSGAQASSNVGLIFEFIAVADQLGADLNPVPIAHNGDVPASPVVYANIEATTGAAPTVEFTFVKIA